MKPESLKNIKAELKHLSSSEIEAICLRLARFKKENKELLSYILFYSNNEETYIEEVKLTIDEQFKLINTKNYYYIRKSIRKILRQIKKNIRYSPKKETEVELLMHFCKKLKHFNPPISGSVQLQNTYNRQKLIIEKSIGTLHEDLQYDYNLLLEEL